MTWLGLFFSVTILAWIVAEAIPIFSELLSIVSALFVSGLSFYIPPIMWYVLLRERAWYERHNLKTAILNGIVFVVGMIIFGCGTYASIAELVSSFLLYRHDDMLTLIPQIDKFQPGSVGKPSTCSS
jgi:hypothetical protein